MAELLGEYLDGIGGAILEDFCARLAGEGFKILKTDFVLRRFYTKHGFHVDARWGGLVRFLEAMLPDPSPQEGDASGLE
jgi:hypothetical protein